MSQGRSQALIRNLNRLLREIPSGPTPARVHQFRTTIRRIETVAAAAAGKPGKNLKALKPLRRRAGTVRDLDVQIAALRGLKLESASKDKATLLRALEKKRAKRERKLVAALEQASEKNVRRQLQRALPPAGSRLEKHPDNVALALEKFTAAVQEHGAISESNLHAFRVDCKRARYLAEMSGDVPEAKALISQLKRIQDAAGEWHDWLTLTDNAERVLSSSAGRLLSALRTGTRAKFLHALRVIWEVKAALLASQPGRKPSASELPRKTPARAS